MWFFDIGIKIFIGGLILFFIIFGNFCYHWSDPNTKKERLIIAFMVPFLYICLIFPIGVLILFIIDGLIKYIFKIF